MSETEAPVRDEEWRLVVHHDSYYQWVPCKETEVPDDAIVVDSYYEGFKMVRVRVDEPTTSVTTVHVPGLDRTDADREALGLAKRGRVNNLIRELEDGTWPKQFPVDTITKVEVIEGSKSLEKKLNSHFVQGDDE